MQTPMSEMKGAHQQDMRAYAFAKLGDAATG